MSNRKPIVPVLAIEHLDVRFGGNNAIDDLSLNLHAGELIVIVGKNGSGKTTLLNAISGFVPLTGHIVLAGINISSAVSWQRARMGIVRTFQTPRWFGRLSEDEDIFVTWAARSLNSTRTLLGRGGDILKSLRLRRSQNWNRDAVCMFEPDLGSARVREIERIRVNRPRVALLDEPFSGLNSAERDGVISQIQKLIVDGCAVLLVEHQLELAISISHTVLELDQGRPVFYGSMQQFRVHKRSTSDENEPKTSDTPID